MVATCKRPGYLLHIRTRYSVIDFDRVSGGSNSYGRSGLLCPLLLLLVSVTVQHIAADASTGAACSLNIRGAGLSATNVTGAKIRCTGGPVHIVVDQGLLGHFVDQWTGVQATATACIIQPCQCLLTIHNNTKVTFEDAIVRDLSGGDPDGGDRTLPSALLCITGGSQVTLRRAQVYDNEATAIRVQGPAQLHMDSCLIANNTQGYGGSPGGGLSATGNNKIAITHSRFEGNNCTSGCGINMAGGSLHISNSQFVGHAAAQSGGGASFQLSTKVTMTDTEFVGNSAAGDGGGFSAAETSRLDLDTVTLEGNSARGSGGGAYLTLSLWRHELTRAIGVNVTNNWAQYGGGLCINSSSSSADAFADVSVSDSRFQNNSAALFGGAIMLGGKAKLSLAGSSIEGNRAGKYRIGTGGGIMINTDAAITIRDTIIAKNYATRHGGGLRVLTDNFDRDELLAAAEKHSNRALYEGAYDVSFAPRQLAIAAHNAGGGFVPDISASLWVNVSVTGPQQMPTAGEDVEATMKEEHGTTTLAKSASLKDGIAHLKLQLKKPPGRYLVTFKVASDDDIPSVNMTIQIKPCQQGYVTAELNPYTCQLCKPGQFSFDPQQTTCTQCPVLANCSGGASLRPREQYWHSSPQSTQIHRCLNPQACIPDETATVGRDLQGVPAYKSSQCSPGHEGNMCGVCSQGWAKVRTLHCKPCVDDAHKIIIYYSLAAVAVLLAMKLVLHFSNRDTHTLSTQQLMPSQASALGFAAAQAVLAVQNSVRSPSLGSQCSSQGGAAPTAAPIAAVGFPMMLQMSRSVSNATASLLPTSSSIVSTPFGQQNAQQPQGGNGHLAAPVATAAPDRQADLSPTDIAKPFILYLQYLVLVASMPVKWPSTLYWPTEVLNWFWATASSHVLRVECLLRARPGLPVTMQKLLFDLSMPLVLLLVLLCIEAGLHMIWKCRRRHPGPILPHGQVSRAVIVAMFFFTPFYMRTVLHLFACVPLDEKRPPPETPKAVGSWWVGDMNQHCGRLGDGYYQLWAWALGLPLVLIFCAMLPIAVGILTWHHRNRLDETSFQQRFSFLTRSYKPSRCWWEAVVLVETVLLCLCAAYAAVLGAYFQTLLMMAAFASMFVLVLVLQPHQQPLVGRVALQGYGTLFVTSYCVLTLLSQQVDGTTGRAGHTPAPAYGQFIGVAVLLGNLLHIGYCLWQLLRAFNWPRAGSITDRIMRCCGCSPGQRGALPGTQTSRV